LLTLTGVRLCHSGRVLSEMRNRSGRPNWAVRGIAIVLALLLAGPLSVYLLQGLFTLIDAAF
jgi:predicted type IV restriction endonuclease